MSYQIKNAINYKKLLILIQKQGKQRVNMSLHLMASLMIIMQQQNLRYKSYIAGRDDKTGNIDQKVYKVCLFCSPS